jgi:hypothetical protein
LGARFLSADSFFLGWDAIRFSTFCTPSLPTCLDTIDDRAANFFVVSSQNWSFSFAPRRNAYGLAANTYLSAIFLIVNTNFFLHSKVLPMSKT